MLQIRFPVSVFIVKMIGCRKHAMLRKVGRSLLFILVVSASVQISSAGRIDPAPKYGTESTSSTQILTLKRGKETSDGAVIGVLKAGPYTFYTLEDKEHLIPPGRYNLSVFYSTKFKIRVIRVMAVPGRTDIEIHPGNFKKDSHGCLLIGISHTDTSVVASQAALRRLLHYLGGASASLTISD